MVEKWEWVTSYEGTYKISNLGRIKSIDRIVIKSNGHKHPTKGYLLSKAIHPKGYEFVTLWKQGKGTGFLVHRLVAVAFIPNPMNLPEVNHKDTNKRNNIYSNLEWSTGRDNILHSVKSGTFKKSVRRIFIG